MKSKLKNTMKFYYIYSLSLASGKVTPRGLGRILINKDIHNLATLFTYHKLLNHFMNLHYICSVLLCLPLHLSHLP